MVPIFAGDRLVFRAGYLYNDLASVPITGGDATFLADAPEEESLVGRLGSNLIVHGGDRNADGELVRVAADGSERNVVMASARYVGAVTEACGAVPPAALSACRDE